MQHFSGQAPERDLPFRTDGDQLNQLDQQRNALASLADAVSRCEYEDMRTPEVLAALEFLRATLPARNGADTALQHFRQALALPNPQQRHQVLQYSYRTIELAGEG